jgi:hypothetical protein
MSLTQQSLGSAQSCLRMKDAIARVVPDARDALPIAPVWSNIERDQLAV